MYQNDFDHHLIIRRMLKSRKDVEMSIIKNSNTAFKISFSFSFLLLSMSYLMVNSPSQIVWVLRRRREEADMLHGIWAQHSCPCLPTNILLQQACLRVRQQWVILTNLFLRSSGFCFLPAGSSPKPTAQLPSCGAVEGEGGAACACSPPGW